MGANIITSIATDKKAIALTFDDGPDPHYTGQLLDIFREVSGKATFFMIGEQMLNYPDVVNKVIEEGHEIGNHTYTHAKLTELSVDDRLHEIKDTEKLIKETTGKKPALLRPPYLDLNDEVASEIEGFGYHMIGAVNLEARDWAVPGVEHILNETRPCLKEGNVLIFHDGLGDRSQTVSAVKTLVHELDAQGYKIVTVSELLELNHE